MSPVDSRINGAFATLTRRNQFHAIYCARSEGHSVTIRARSSSSHTSLVPGHSLAGIAKKAFDRIIELSYLYESGVEVLGEIQWPRNHTVANNELGLT